MLYVCAVKCPGASCFLKNGSAEPHLGRRESGAILGSTTARSKTGGWVVVELRVLRGEKERDPPLAERENRPAATAEWGEGSVG